MKLVVITKIPDPDSASASGNLAAPLGELYLENGIDQAPRHLEQIHPAMALALRKQVFQLGELLIVDDDGREINGAQRKPSKWGVGYQSFELEQIVEAIELVGATQLETP